MRVLVVDDDFRVAGLHARFVDGVDGFETVGTARTAAEAEEMVERLEPDLVLLDNHLPDAAGVAVARRMNCDLMIVTADSSVATLRAAVSAGAVNVIVKPFSPELLAARLQAYASYRNLTGSGARELGQQGVDRALSALRQGDRPSAPKGQSPLTARLVIEQLQGAAEPVTAADVSEALGISRATAQRYLVSLAEKGRAEMTLRYGNTGRPEHRYSWADGAAVPSEP